MAKTKGSDCYVYAHIKKHDNSVFYIGIGSSRNYKRAFTSNGRNNMWHKIVNKYECFSSVLFSSLTWDEACEIEKTFISFYGRIDNNTGVLCNMTDGGDGNLGGIFSKETIEKMRKSQLGKKHSEATKEKFRNRIQSKETIEKIRRLKTGLKASEETRNKMKLTNLKGINSAALKISKIVLDLNTGIFYDSVKDASKTVGVTKSHLSGMLLGRYKNKTNMVYA